MTPTTESSALASSDHSLYLRLLADSLVIITFCGLAICLATSFAVSA